MLVMFLAASFGMQAQTKTYRECVKKLLQQNDAFSTKEMKWTLQMAMSKMAKAVPGYINKKMSEAELKQYIDKRVDAYLASQYKKDLVDIMLPYYQKHLTEAQLKRLVVMLNTEQARISNAHIMAVTQKSQQPIREYMSSVLPKLMAGEKWPIPKAKNCSANYKQLFDQYYQISGMNNVYDQLFSSVEQLLGNANKSNSDTQNPLKQIKAGFKTALPVLLRNSYINTVTENDLAYQIKLCKTSEYQSYMKASSAILTDIGGITRATLEKFDNWQKRQK